MSTTTTPLHPKSRKVEQLKRKELREKRLKKNELRKKKELSPDVERALYIKSKLELDRDQYSSNEVCDWLEIYLKRFDEELFEIQEYNKKYSSNSKGNREEILLHLKQEEMENFTTSGLLCPDITKKINTEKLRRWNGEYKFLHNVPLRKFKNEKLLQQIST